MAAGSATLVIRSGPQQGSEFAVGAETVLGREPSSTDVLIDDPGVSRRHAVVRDDGGRVTVADLGSANGTEVNGAAIRGEVAVADGDEIRLGSTVLAVHTGERPGMGAGAGVLGRSPGQPGGRRQPAGLSGRLDEPGNVPALAAAFTGVLSVVLLIATTGVVFPITFFTSIAAIVLGTMGVRRVRSGETDSHLMFARVGRISGIIGVVLSVLAAIVVVLLLVLLDVAADNLPGILERVNEEFGQS